VTKHKFVVIREHTIIKGEENHKEFEFKNLKLYILDGALWVVCRHGAKDIKFRELHELDSVAEGTPVTIGFSKEFLDLCREERAIEEFDHPMGIDEFNTFLGQALTPEEYRERYGDNIEEQLRRDLAILWFEHREDSLSLFEINIIASRLTDYLLALDN
jgi:hypothetical protein